MFGKSAHGLIAICLALTSFIFVSAITFAGELSAEPEGLYEPVSVSSVRVLRTAPQADVTAPVSVSVGDKILYYIPNRLLDLLDIFRARIRLGPGISATARVTDYASFFGGTYSTWYIGFPGPRNGRKFRSPVGIEKEKGIIIFGVNATDNTEYGPGYSPTELDAGAQVLLIGADLGFDPVELGDFFAGLVFIDLKGDDLEAPRTVQTQTNRYPRKPAIFDGWGQRLDYIQDNLQPELHSRVEQVDAFFGEELEEPEIMPPSEFRLGLYVETTEDSGLDFSLSPNFEAEVSLPNLEKRWKVFLDNQKNDELPGTDPQEREGGTKFGFSRMMEDIDINADVGLKLKWLPVLFARLRWSPLYKWGLWAGRPSARIYYQTDDGFGSVASFSGLRWFGGRKNYMFQSVSAIKWTEVSDGVEWEQTLKLGKSLSALQSHSTYESASLKDAREAFGIRYSLFGHSSGESELDKHRFSLGYRRPIYEDWIFIDIIPSLEWERENDWNTVTKLVVGFDMIFWGAK